MRKVSNEYKVLFGFIVLLVLSAALPVVQFSVFQNLDRAQTMIRLIEMFLLFFELSLLIMTAHEFGHALTAKMKGYHIIAVGFVLFYPVQVNIYPPAGGSDALVLSSGTIMSYAIFLLYSLFVLLPLYYLVYVFNVFGVIIPTTFVIFDICLIGIFLVGLMDRKMLRSIRSRKG